MKNWIAGTASRHGSSFSAGISAAIIAAQVAATWILICGSSSTSLATGLFAAGGGVFISGYVSFGKPGNGRQKDVLLTVLLLTLSWGMAFSLNTLLKLSANLAGESAASLAFVVPGLLVCLQTALLTSWMNVGEGQKSGTASTFAGLALGLFVPVAFGVLVVPVAVFVTCSLLVTAVTRRFDLPIADPEDRRDTASRLTMTNVIAVSGAAIAIHGGVRIMSVLMPMSFAIAALASVVTLTIVAVSSAPFINRLISSRALMIAVSLLCLMPLFFTSFQNGNLSLNATISNVFLLTLSRAVQLAGIWMAAVLAWKCVRTATTSTITATEVAIGIFMLAVGVLLATYGLPADAGLFLGAVLFAVAVWISAERELRVARVAISSAVAAGGVIAIVMPMNGAESAQLLFSARSAQGHRMGLKREVIEQSHCTRLLEEHNCDGDHLTVWRTAGDQVLIRRNGFPVGQITANSMTTPQPIPETLTAILPLVMHRQVQSVLLLGDDSGAALRVCAGFPVHTIEAVRPDAATTNVADRYSWGEQSSLKADDRIIFRRCDASVAVRKGRDVNDRFDVVIASSPNPVSLRCQDQLSAEFYQGVRSQLNNDGVFCQRIVQHDLGAEPLMRIVSAIRRTFGRVVVTQMAPGQIAIAASVEADGLLDEGLLDRLRREHVKRVLGRSGWDWSQVAALPVVDTNDPVGIFEHQPMLTAASAVNGHFVVALPLEGTRWGNKAGELQQSFAPHQQRMADAAPRSAAYAEFGRRFSAVVQQKEILMSFPDNPWPYRKSLKMEMQRNSGPPIESIRDGKVIRRADPLDAYRKDYFETLGQMLAAATEGTADPRTIQKFRRFTSKYEPLLSYFAHHEVIRVHESTGHPSPALELRNRLHTIYFSEGGDFSIRHVNRAMSQLLDDPELLATDAARYDHVNSMLQELVRRWEVRIGYNPPSASRTQQDVDECIRVANRALDAMQEWRATVNVSADELKSRRKFINQALISPLRTYREQVVSHRMKHAPSTPATNSVGPGELPMLADPADMLTN